MSRHKKVLTQAQYTHLKRLVLRTYQMLDQGMGYQEIADYLNSKNVRSCMGRQFNYLLIQKMVSHIRLNKVSHYSKAYQELLTEGLLKPPVQPAHVW